MELRVSFQTDDCGNLFVKRTVKTAIIKINTHSIYSSHCIYYMAKTIIKQEEL